MDLTSPRQRKQTSVTYGKRSRAANSTHSSPAVTRPTATVTSFSGSSDDEPTPSGRRAGRTDTAPVNPSPPSRTSRASHSSPKGPASAQPTISSASPVSRPDLKLASGATNKSPTSTPSGQPASTSRKGLSLASTTTPHLFPKAGSSSVRPSTTQSLPLRPPRASSPSDTKCTRPSTPTLPVKRSVSTSPRKLQSSVSPSKRLARSRTPSRPAHDLANLFDVIDPTPAPSRSPFVRSESQPTVPLHQDDAETSLRGATVYAKSPLQSPTLPSTDLDDAQLLSPDALISPSKRPRMADRMAPRAARSSKTKLDDVADALSDSRRGSLRRSETAPSAFSDTGSKGLFGLETQTLKDKEENGKSAQPSDAGSAWLDAASQTDSQSQEGAGSARSVRRVAGIKQTSTSNAKRTYGLQRSFLADHAEETLLTESTAQPPSSTAPRSIEDEIEAELRRGSSTPASALQPALSDSVHLPESTPAAPRESYAELLKKWGEGADDIEWDESQDPTLNLKSITSLRSTGELRRFNDDLEYLFSGLGPSQNLSIRKSSAVELVRLLCGKPDVGSLDEGEDDEAGEVEDTLASAQSADFLRKLKASDLITRLFDLFKGAEAGEGVDDILDATVAMYVAKLLKIPSTAEPLTRERWSQLYDTLGELLARANRNSRHERKDGFALLRLHELKQHKIASKSDRKTLEELRAIARISKLFVTESKSWTLRNLALAASCSLIALPRRLLSETAINDLLVDASGTEHRPSLFDAVLHVIVAEGDKAQQRLADFAKGLELVSPAAVEAIPDLDTVDVCIRFLDKGMDILYLELDQNVPASNETLEALQYLVSFAVQAAPFGTSSSSDSADSPQTSSSASRALQALHGLFKTLLDLSQVDANWSESLASSQHLQASVLRALLLSYRKAVQVRQLTASTDEPKRSKSRTQEPEHIGIESAQKVDVTQFDDVVHLSLALLTNLLIKQLDKARDSLEAVQLEATCWGRRNCSTHCTCEDRLPALRLLARLFFETRVAAARQDDSNAAYLSNSIATALAQFAVGGPTRLASCRAALDAELPSSTSTGDSFNVIKEHGFQTLLDAVDEFAVVHEAALNAERIRAAEAEEDTEADLQGVGDEKEEAEEAEELGNNSNPMAVEAGQLIKDLALALRQMA